MEEGRKGEVWRGRGVGQGGGPPDPEDGLVEAEGPDRPYASAAARAYSVAELPASIAAASEAQAALCAGDGAGTFPPSGDTACGSSGGCGRFAPSRNIWKARVRAGHVSAGTETASAAPASPPCAEMLMEGRPVCTTVMKARLELRQRSSDGWVWRVAMHSEREEMMEGKVATRTCVCVCKKRVVG